jgi:hypothetical protein
MFDIGFGLIPQRMLQETANLKPTRSSEWQLRASTRLGRRFLRWQIDGLSGQAL